MSPRARMFVIALALGCPSAPTARDAHAPGAGAPARPVDAAALRVALSSIDEGGAPLVELVGDDAWFAHHGSTEEIRAGDHVRDHLRQLAGAYPGLRFEAGTPVPIGNAGWIVEVAMRDDTRDAQARLVALARTRRGVLSSIELFGTDPRGPFDGMDEGSGLADVSALELEAVPSPTSREIARLLGGRARIRLSAHDDDLVLAIVDVEGHTKRNIPLVRHMAAIARRQDDRVVDVRVFGNPREGSTIEMSNRSGFRGLNSRLDSDALRWGARLVYCCEHGVHTRKCDRVSTDDMERCRATGAIALVCREAYHCTGTDCFCCSHGLDGACAMEPVVEPEIEVPNGRRPPEPSIWSPY